MLKKEAKEITGGLSKPSKMPGPSYNLPAAACITGAKLAKVPGTVCYGCYALKVDTDSPTLDWRSRADSKASSIRDGWKL